ncbi:MAG: C40 family peptidase [Saprospiraceae bacterium]|nr:C40 family peptidase [Saprospiraceae bacterium]
MSSGLTALKTTLLFVLFSTTLLASPGFPFPKTYANEDADAMCFREAVAGWAENYLGLPYRYAGRSPETGFDCSGFTHFVFKEFGFELSPSSATQSKQGVHIPLNEVTTGDLLFFGRSGRIQHVALIVKRTEEGIFCAHATCSRGIIVENVSKSSYWSPRILFARDVISGADNIPPVNTVYAVENKPKHKNHTAFLCDDQPLLSLLPGAFGRDDARRDLVFDLSKEHPTARFQ